MSNTKNWYYFEHFPAYRAINSKGVIVCVGSLADCQRVAKKREVASITMM